MYVFKAILVVYLFVIVFGGVAFGLQALEKQVRKGTRWARLLYTGLGIFLAVVLTANALLGITSGFWLTRLVFAVSALLTVEKALGAGKAPQQNVSTVQPPS